MQNGNLILSGTGGSSNVFYNILSATNIALPLFEWTVSATNQMDGTGSFFFTNALQPGAPEMFYRLRLP